MTRRHTDRSRATTLVLAALTLLSTAPRLGAQSASGQSSTSASSVADAAATGRRLVGEAIAALRSGDTTRAHRLLVDATAAWPTQSAYLWTRGQVALAARDTSDAIAALTQFAALGLTRTLAGDRLLSTVANHSRFAPVSALLRANATPLVRSTVHATLADSTLWAEGLTWHAQTKSFFVASIRHRTIYAHGPDGTRPLWTEPRANIGAILGLCADPDGVHLWATTAGIPQMAGFTPADSSIAALLKVRIRDGGIAARWDLPPSAAGHTLGDVTMGPSGDVFTSDSREPVLYRLRAGTGQLEAITNPLFRSLQGIATHPDGRHLYVADYSHGVLRVDLQTRAVTRLADAPSSTSLGVDGLLWYDGALIGIQNGVAPARVMRFTLDASGTRITAADVLDRNAAVADEPTIGTLVGNTYVYVANSQWEKHNDAGARIPGTKLAPTLLLALPLTPSR